MLVLPNGVILSGGGGESTVRAWSRTPRLVPTNVELKVGREDDEVKFSWVLRSSVERIDDHKFSPITISCNILQFSVAHL